MTIITNEPVSTDSTSLAGPLFRGHTFVAGYIFFPVRQPVSVARTFHDEREAFASLLPELTSRYPGEWVAISGGDIIEHDSDRKLVTRRFFQRRRHGPVYIGFVGPTPVIRQVTPFRARRRA